MSDNDQELIQACRKGDNRAWDKVLDRYERLVFSIPLNYGLPYEDAADICQLTFTILLQSLDSLHEDSRLAPWLATVARRHTWRLLSRRRREDVGREEDLSESPFLPAENSRALARLEMIEWLNDGLNHLNERCRELLLALYFDPKQPAYTDVAEKLKMSVGSVGPTRARCLEKMKEHLTKI